MSALTDALLAAQARATAAIQKAYIGNRITREEASLQLIDAGATDDVDREALLKALDLIIQHGAATPAEPQRTVIDRSHATQAQRDLIARMSREREITWTVDLPGLDRDNASKLIEQLKAGTAREEDWSVPF